MKINRVPKVGDVLKFKSDYTFTTDIGDYLKVTKGTLAKVIERSLISTDDWLDEVGCSLIIAIGGDETRLFKFNYILHQLLVDILEESVAIKLLYEGDAK